MRFRAGWRIRAIDRSAGKLMHLLWLAFCHWNKRRRCYAVRVSKQTGNYAKARADCSVASVHQTRARAQKEVEEDMLTAPDVAREIGVARRAEARKSVLSAAARLARRERRLQRRIQRLDEQLAGQSLDV